MLPLLIAVAQGPRFPAPVVPAGWGVNIHFTDEQPGETAMIGSTFRWARMDFMWHQTEKEKGKYDFSAYDRLVASLTKAGVRPYFILDYGNDLYQKGSPRNPESRAAFCRWVAAMVARYKGRGFVWEMWNEPNIFFWQPKPNVDEYIALALEVGKTIRRVGPQETYLGPATSGFDWPFLQKCLDAGLLKYWDAISVHPYRQNEPESVVDDWVRLRGVIDRAGGTGKPMLSGEWGYSELYSGQSKERQAQMIARAYLTNLSCGVPISIWYDWKDDGTDPKETEHHFGTVLPDLTPKPAYTAATSLARDLAGFSYVTRLHTKNPRQWLLLFRKGKEARVAAWTTGEPSDVGVPGPLSAGARPVARLGPQPMVLKGPQLAPLLDNAPLPWSVMVSSRRDAFAFRVRTGAGRLPPGVSLLEGPATVRVGMATVGGASFDQKTHLIPARPLRPTVQRERDGRTTLRIANPYGRDLGGLLVVAEGKPIRPSPDGAYVLSRGARSVVLRLGDDQVSLPVPRFTPVSLKGATAVAEGDATIRAAVSATTVPDGTRLAYDFDQGWRFAELRLPSGKIEGRPTTLGMWVAGNGSGDILRMRYTDSTGQTFQPDAGPIDWKGWRYVSFALDGSGGRWGGANDGRIHYPIQIATVALVDMPGGRGGKGAITVDRPVLTYDDGAAGHPRKE